MLKPFYNKKGHLGMTRAELLEKLNGGVFVVNFADDGEGGVVCDKTYDEIDQHAQNNELILGYNTNDKEVFTFLGTSGGPNSYTFMFLDIDAEENALIIFFNKIQIFSDNSIIKAPLTATVAATIE